MKPKSDWMGVCPSRDVPLLIFIAIAFHETVYIIVQNGIMCRSWLVNDALGIVRQHPPWIVVGACHDMRDSAVGNVSDLWDLVLVSSPRKYSLESFERRFRPTS